MVDIATDASLKPASHPKPLRVGLDIGSTTVKAVVLDQSDSLGDTLFSDYRRHHANVRATVAGLLVDIHKKLVDLGRGDDLLNERHMQIVSKRQTAGTGDRQANRLIAST